MDLRPSTLVSALRDEKKDYLIALTKSAGIIKELVDKNLHPLLNGKTAQEMWAILEARFHHISLMSVIRIFSDACAVKLLECKDIINYTSRYQVAFDKITSLTTEDGWMSRKTVEITLQGSLLQHLGKGYSALVSAIETEWKEETTNLSDTILRVIRHAEINKGNAQDLAESTKVLSTGIQRAPKGTCTTPECVERRVTSHYNDRCWIKNPELRAKYSLRQMKPRGSNRNLNKAASATPATKKEASPPPELKS